jgi:EpsD family peptidyl-prolyl cis-trans isomerase
MAKASSFSTGWVMSQRVVAAIALALLASGCQKKASGQTVAVVNNDEITASDLNSELMSENASVTGSTKEARAQALQNLIDRRLLAQQARSEGLDKSPDFINQQRRATEDLLIRMLVMRQVNTSQVPSPQEVDQFEASHPNMFAKREAWTLQQLLFPLQKDPAVLAKIKAAKTLDEVAQALTSSGVQFSKATRKIDTAVLPPNVYAQLMQLRPNEPFVVPGPDREVASVITAREPAPLAGDQARTIALNAMKRDQVQKLVQDRVKSLKASAKIQYQPGFAPPKS